MAQTKLTYQPNVLAADTLTGDKVVNHQKEDLGKIISISDGNGTPAPLQLIAVTPSQVNAVLPGSRGSTVNLITGDGRLISGSVQMDTTAPSLFTADESGIGSRPRRY